MPLPLLAAGAIAQGVGGLAKGITGFIQRSQANKWLKKNEQPTEAMPSEILRNQQMAELNANVGLPSQQYNNAMKQIQLNQMKSIRSANQLGGGKALSILGGVNEYGNDAINDLNAQDAQARMANQEKLANANANTAQWKSRLFDENIRKKWLRKYDQKMNELAAGNMNIASGLDSLTSAGANAVTGGLFDKSNKTTDGVNSVNSVNRVPAASRPDSLLVAPIAQISPTSSMGQRIPNYVTRRYMQPKNYFK